MFFLRGDPRKSAAKHEKRARAWQERGNEIRAAKEWVAAGHDYSRISDFKRAYESFLQASQFYLALQDAKSENSTLLEAVNVATAASDFNAAAKALDQVIRIGTRRKDNSMLLHAFALKTIIFIAANDLARARETHREAQKVDKRLDRKKTTLPLFLIASTLTTRFIEGQPILDETILSSRVDESEHVSQLIEGLLQLLTETKDSTLTLAFDREKAKLKTRVSGHCSFKFSTPLQITEVKLTLPPNVALLEEPVLPDNAVSKYELTLSIEPRLPGSFELGPLSATLQKDDQQFCFTSNTTTLEIAAAKPRINLDTTVATPPRTQEEFEFIVNVVNDSLGDASEVTITITLPPTLILKTGTLEKRIITLASQQSVSFPLFIIATKAGAHEGVITCTYKGPGSRTMKFENPFAIEVLARVPKEKD
jgi:tetratricopeptide (TPR) repeat protein